jgi:tRNA threonylcarbamoyladenosine biosynthesis protein TsaE
MAKMSPASVVTHSEGQTKTCGKKLAQLLEIGDIVGLSGELGTGKTSFARGVAEGLGVGSNAWIRSPTFTLINEYHGCLPVYHIDLYRVSTAGQQQGLDLREYLYGDGVCLVEWFEYLPASETGEFLEVDFAHRGGNRRTLTFTAHGERYEQILSRFKV